MNSTLAARVMRIYEEFDNQISRLPTQFGIHCPPGCGTCCSSAKVEATPLEMIPLAEELWRSGRAHALVDQYDGKALPDICLFYTPDALHFNHGRCSVYPHRPTLCRLFGFAAIRNKRGRREFAACRFVREMAPQAVLAVQADLDSGGEILMFTEAASRIGELEPSMNRQYPINRALWLALEKTGMILQYTIGESPNELTDPETDPLEPAPFKRCS
ncbi:MAG: YkgJ family cysteine cluster protein [Deltaproteobacteria bacterium]|nr:YkgJ family cysteine cluster protein [Deltaproteobacteria bacterium]